MRVIFAVALAFWMVATHGAAADVQALIADGKLQPALDQVEVDLAQNKSDVTLQFLKGLVLARMNRLDQAAEIFQHITEEHPELPEPFNNLAVVHAARGDFEAAQKALQMAINTHPSYATAHENLGDIYAKMASQAYNHALQLDEANSSAKAKLAMIDDLFPVPASNNGAGKTALAAAAPTNPGQPAGGVAAPAPAQPQPQAQLQPQPQPQPAQPVSAPQPVAMDTAPEPEPVTEKPAPVPAQVSSEPELRAAVESWAKVWSERDVAAYLAAYGAEFAPADGTSRAQWEQTRRARLQQSSFIRVDLASMKVVEHGPEHAQISFDQHYQSDAFSDDVRKILIMKKVGADWKIVEETVR